MPTEIADTIDELDPTKPDNDLDPVGESDDHLRLLKTTLQGSFPNIVGVVTASTAEINGWEARIAANEASITAIDGRVTTIEGDYALGSRAINTAADSGLAGGGDLTGDRDLVLDANNLAAVAAPAAADLLPIYDDSAAITGAVTFGALQSGLDHDSLGGFVANEHIDHSSVQIGTAAGSGLSGGGDITATRNLALDLNGLATLSGASDFNVTEDSWVVDDNGSPKRILMQDAGIKVVGLDAIQTFELADANTMQVLTGTTDRTWTIPDNSAVAFQIGTVILLGCQGTGEITLTAPGSAVINSVGSLTKVSSKGTAVLVKVAVDTWHLSGNLTS